MAKIDSKRRLLTFCDDSGLGVPVECSEGLPLLEAPLFLVSDERTRHRERDDDVPQVILGKKAVFVDGWEDRVDIAEE